MRLTALDIQKHHFASSWRGFDPGEVETFLRLVAEDFEGLVRECETLREKVRSLETRVEDLTGNEHALRETLVTAQALSEDDEAIVFDCDLDLCEHYRSTVFAFEKHRRIEHYDLITSQTGVVPPP